MDDSINRQQQVITSLSNSIAGRMSETFSRVAKRRLEVKIKEMKVESYQTYIESLPHFTIVGIFGTELSREQILVEVHPSVAYYLIDRLAGGIGEVIPIEKKKLTDIERMMFEKFVFPELLSSWEEAWESIAGLQLKLSFIRVEHDPFLTRRMEGKFLHMTMDASFEKGKEILNICIPYKIIEMIGMPQPEEKKAPASVQEEPGAAQKTTPEI